VYTEGQLAARSGELKEPWVADLGPAWGDGIERQEQREGARRIERTQDAPPTRRSTGDGATQ
jgi:hypothetical protein